MNKKFARSASLLLIALTLLILPLPTIAQTPAITLTGLTGAAAIDGGSLGPSFDPDPFPVEDVSGGGSVRLALLNPDSGCLGRYHEAPSFSFNLLQPVELLRVFFVADDPDADATLVVRMPNQQHYCEDDFEDSNNPLVDVVGNSTSGGVQVWVGSMYAEPVTGTLYLSASDSVNPNTVEESASATEEASESMPAESLELLPERGDEVLLMVAGESLIYEDEIVGGAVNIEDHDLGEECTGYMAPQPIKGLFFISAPQHVRIYFVAENDADTTLVVLDAFENWVCNDNSFDTLNPTVDFETAGSGGPRFTIWVGTHDPEETVTGTLYIVYDEESNTASPASP
jgi:hypothetical protein